MAFRASNMLPAEGLQYAKKTALGMQTYCNTTIQNLLSDAPSGVIIDIVETMAWYRNEFNAVKAIPGIADYARAQEDDVNYDVVVEFNAMIASVEAAITEVTTTFPTDASDYLLARKWDSILPVDGTEDRIFSSAQTSGLRTALQAVSDAVV